MKFQIGLKFVAHGKTQHLAAWARELGCNPAAILYRINNGYSEEQAVTGPFNGQKHNAKLTDAAVKEIRSSYPVKPMQQLADEFGLSKKAVLNILHCRTYVNVT